MNFEKIGLNRASPQPDRVGIGLAKIGLDVFGSDRAAQMPIPGTKALQVVIYNTNNSNFFLILS